MVRSIEGKHRKILIYSSSLVFLQIAGGFAMSVLVGTDPYWVGNFA